MTGDLSPLELVLNASLIVQIVMGLLLLASLVSWSIMLRKRSELRRARSDADRFEEVFWSGGDLSAMFKAIDQSRRVTRGMESIFESGFREFSRLRQQGGIAAAQLLEGARRGMRVALLRESDRLEHSLAMLATIGSTSPYVGLFGTVWGIMSAFHGLGNVQQATLAMVAPGIAEALIATAMGLFAAIPA
ncbi:MAG: protein TolQ, partial [Povalibacter sp.]